MQTLFPQWHIVCIYTWHNNNEISYNLMLERLRYSMQALQVLSRTQEVVSNNLANMNTAGFKKDKLFFHALQDQINGQSLQNTQINQMVNISPGEFKQTGNPFDLAIEGQGFFRVEKDGEMFLTRSGRFHLDNQGFLRDEQNAYVMGRDGAVYIPEILDYNRENESVLMEIAKDGTIRVNDEDVDKIELFGVENLQNLNRQTNSYFKPRDGVQLVNDNTSNLNQGFYETGNIDPMEEMGTMMTTMRLFESQQRAMTTMDDILGQVTRNLGHVES